MDDEIKDVLGNIGALVHGANSAELVKKIVEFYDYAAETAYERLMLKEEMIDSPEEVARLSWEYADAMMAERVKRGLGKPPERE